MPLHCLLEMCEEEGSPAQWLRLIQNLRLFPGQKWNYLGRNFIKRMCGVVFKKVIFCCNMVCRQSLLPVFASDKAGQHEWGTGFCERLADLQQAVAAAFCAGEQPCPSQGEGGVDPRLLGLSFPGNWSGLVSLSGSVQWADGMSPASWTKAHVEGH